MVAHRGPQGGLPALSGLVDRRGPRRSSARSNGRVSAARASPLVKRASHGSSRYRGRRDDMSPPTHPVASWRGHRRPILRSGARVAARKDTTMPCKNAFRVAVLDDNPVSTKLGEKVLRRRFPNAEITVSHEPHVVPGQDVYLLDNQFGSSECAVALATEIRRTDPDCLIILW